MIDISIIINYISYLGKYIPILLIILIVHGLNLLYLFDSTNRRQVSVLFTILRYQVIWGRGNPSITLILTWVYKKCAAQLVYVLFWAVHIGIIILITLIYGFCLYNSSLGNVVDITELYQISMDIYSKLVIDIKLIKIWISLTLTSNSTYYLLMNFYVKHNIFSITPGTNIRVLIQTIWNNKWSILLKVVIIFFIVIIIRILIRSYINIYLFKSISFASIFLVTYWALPFISFISTMLFYLFFKGKNEKKDLNFNYINNGIANNVNLYNITVITFILHLHFISFQDIYRYWMLSIGVIILLIIIWFIPRFFLNFLLSPTLNLILLLLDLDIKSLLIKMEGIEIFNRSSCNKLNFSPNFRTEITEFKSKKEITENGQASMNESLTKIRRWEDGTPTKRTAIEARGFFNYQESKILNQATAFQKNKDNEKPIFSTFSLFSNKKENGSVKLGFEGGYWINNSVGSNKKTLIVAINPSTIEEKLRGKNYTRGQPGIYSVKSDSIKQDLSRLLGLSFSNLSSYNFDKVLLSIPFDLDGRSTISLGMDRREKVYNVCIIPNYATDGFKLRTRENKWHLTNPEVIFSPYLNMMDSFKIWNHIHEYIEGKNIIEHMNKYMLYVTSSEHSAHISVGEKNWLLHYTKEFNNINLPWISVAILDVHKTVTNLKKLGIDIDLILKGNRELLPNTLQLVTQGFSSENKFMKFPILSSYSQQTGLQDQTFKSYELNSFSLYFSDGYVKFKDSIASLVSWLSVWGSGREGDMNVLTSEVTEMLSKRLREDIRDNLFESIQDIDKNTLINKFSFNTQGYEYDIWSMIVPDPDKNRKIIFCNSVSNVFDILYPEEYGQVPAVLKFPSYINPMLKGGLYNYLYGLPTRSDYSEDTYVVLLDRLCIELGFLDYKTPETPEADRYLQYYTMGYRKDDNTIVNILNVLNSNDHNILVEYLNQFLKDIPNNNKIFHWK